MKKDIDWERVEISFRTGVQTLREIAEMAGCTHQAISKRAKKLGWERNLRSRINAKADALVVKRQVAAVVDAAKMATEQAIIDAGAEAIARVKTAQRTDIARYRELCNRLAAELEAQTDPETADLFERLADLLHTPEGQDPEDSKTLRNARHREFRKVLSLEGRIQNMRSLTDALRSLITLERESYGMDTEVAPDKPAMTFADIWPDAPLTEDDRESETQSGA